MMIKNLLLQVKAIYSMYTVKCVLYGLHKNDWIKKFDTVYSRPCKNNVNTLTSPKIGPRHRCQKSVTN